jgi:transaldolase
MTNPLLELARFGQSYWLDDLSRSMIRSGELQRRVEQDGLTGITSNPTIFHAALSKGTEYDEQLRKLAGEPPHVIYETLIVEDVRNACDILRPVYDRTEGRDGFVSLEISPNLARNIHGSITEARHFWQAVSRPNLLIKVPGTMEGLSVVEELLVEGINVNVTLLFSVERYHEVAGAYMNALERRRADRKPLASVASVASFFVSRIDTLVDKLLKQRIESGIGEAEDLLGKAAVANAKLAYQRYKEIVASGRWHFVEAAGARPQRLLWASTSTKNPAYPDLMYVEPLIGPQTINTMPLQTVAAFADHGKPAATLEQDVDDARRVMGELHEIGIDIQEVTRQLLDEGIQKFVDSYNAILQLIAAKTITK